MKISICIPVYNVEKYVEAAILSVLASVDNYKGDTQYEIIIVNDASTDDSLSAISRIICRRENVVLINHANNLGITGARNTLLKNARGDYIAWVDSDDFVKPNWFSTISDVAVKYKPDVIAFELEYLQHNQIAGRSHFGKKSFSVKDGMVVRINPIEYAVKVIQGIMILDYPHICMVRREKVGEIVYRAPRGVWEDTIFAFDFLPKVGSVVYCSVPLYVYRQRENSAMHTRRIDAWIAEIVEMGRTINKMASPFREAAIVHMMSAMRRVMVLASKEPSNVELQAKAKEFRRFFWQHFGLVLTEPYLPVKRRIADLVTMLPFSNLFLRRLNV